MATKDRRTTPKCMLEKATGKSLNIEMMPAAHKVQIIEYLLSCPASELNEYQHGEWPNFIYEAAKMLIDSRLNELMQVLALCRQMAREDETNARELK